MPYKDPIVRKQKHAEYLRRRYHEDPEYRAKHKKLVRANAGKYRDKIRQMIADFKSQGCIVCGEEDHACLSAHHLDPSTKVDRVANIGYYQAGAVQAKAELEKCICLCENCHRKFHKGRFSLLSAPGL